MSRLSRLPDAARPHVEEIIAIYKHHKEPESNRTPGRDLRKLLGDMNKCATNLLTQMGAFRHEDRLLLSWHYAHAMALNPRIAESEAILIDPNLSDEEVRNAFVADSPIRSIETVQQFAQIYYEVQKFAEFCALAKSVLFRDKPGRRVEVLHMCVNLLNVVLLSFTGKPLSQAAKNRLGYGPCDFAWKVFERADQALSRATVKDKPLTRATVRNVIKNHLVDQSSGDLAKWREHIRAHQK
jgi:hypothetical protein